MFFKKQREAIVEIEETMEKLETDTKEANKNLQIIGVGLFAVAASIVALSVVLIVKKWY